jgi:hypothetical protein
MEELDLEPNATSLDLLRAVYRNPIIPLSVRMRAASIAIQYEHPRLAVVAQINEQSFAEVLERRLKHLKQIENGNGGVIEAKPTPTIETKPPMPRVNDRRFRRI